MTESGGDRRWTTEGVVVVDDGGWWLSEGRGGWRMVEVREREKAKEDYNSVYVVPMVHLLAHRERPMQVAHLSLGLDTISK